MQIHCLLGVRQLMHPDGNGHALMGAAAQAQALRRATLQATITHNQVGGQEEKGGEGSAGMGMACWCAGDKLVCRDKGWGARAMQHTHARPHAHAQVLLDYVVRKLDCKRRRILYQAAAVQGMQPGACLRLCMCPWGTCTSQQGAHAPCSMVQCALGTPSSTVSAANALPCAADESIDVTVGGPARSHRPSEWAPTNKARARARIGRGAVCCVDGCICGPHPHSCAQHTNTHVHARTRAHTHTSSPSHTPQVHPLDLRSAPPPLLTDPPQPRAIAYQLARLQPGQGQGHGHGPSSPGARGPLSPSGSTVSREPSHRRLERMSNSNVSRDSNLSREPSRRRLQRASSSNVARGDGGCAPAAPLPPVAEDLMSPEGLGALREARKALVASVAVLWLDAHALRLGLRAASCAAFVRGMAAAVEQVGEGVDGAGGGRGGGEWRAWGNGAGVCGGAAAEQAGVAACVGGRGWADGAPPPPPAHMTLTFALDVQLLQRQHGGPSGH